MGSRFGDVAPERLEHDRSTTASGSGRPRFHGAIKGWRGIARASRYASIVDCIDDAEHRATTLRLTAAEDR